LISANRDRAMKRGRARRRQSAQQAYPGLIRSDDRLEVWLMQGGRTIQQIGCIGVPLARDALRHGEDMVADMFDEARRTLERRQPVRRLAPRSPRTTRGAA